MNLWAKKKKQFQQNERQEAFLTHYFKDVAEIELVFEPMFPICQERKLISQKSGIQRCQKPDGKWKEKAKTFNKKESVKSQSRILRLVGEAAISAAHSQSHLYCGHEQ